MYANETLKPIQDDELYVGLDGTQWANTDKAKIPELHKVTETPRPDEDVYILDGFIINKNYEQVWNKTLKPIPLPEDVEGTPEYNLKHYAELRAIEYPDFREYLDAQVKKSSDDDDMRVAGLLQEAKYFEDCLNTKLKYPKP